MAYDASLVNTGTQPSQSKPISLFPASFSIPCTQQLWPVLCWVSNSVKQRNRVNEADIKWAQQKGISLSPLSLILDSGANLNIFGNIDLLEKVWCILALSKRICGATWMFQCEQVGQFMSSLDGLPLSKGDHYYSSDSMANILSLALLPKTHHIYMDTNFDNTFYVFDQKGRYLCFYNYPMAVLSVITVMVKRMNIQVWIAPEQEN